MRLRFAFAASLAFFALTQAAQAECLGSCLDGMVAALASLAIYGLIGIVLLVMLIRAKWRKAGVRAGAIIALLTIGVPLVSQAWLAWKLGQTHAREIVGTAPALTERVPLLITPDGTCDYSACEAVLIGRGLAGVFVVPLYELEGHNLTQPVALADLPLEIWFDPDVVSGAGQRRMVSLSEREVAAREIDYLIVTAQPYHPADPGALEAALRGNSAVKGMAQGEAVRLLLAPLEPGKGSLSLADLRPDLLDLTLLDRALALPLAPLNYQSAANSAFGTDAATRAICPGAAPAVLANCHALLER